MCLRQLELTYESLKTFADFFAKQLKPNTTILLNGEIGSGKTTWTKHLFRALGYEGIVSSPTFNLIKQYEGEDYHLVHVDAYRNLSRGYINLDEYLESPYILCVEWSEYIQDEIPESYIQLHIEASTSEESRKYTIELCDDRYKAEDFVW